MGRQWLHSKRAAASLKKSQAVGKIVKEITVAARTGGGDPSSNPRLAAAIEKARRESVARDVIERAVRKGSGEGAERAALEHLVFEGYAPHKVPVIVEAYTDNPNRTIPEIRVLFRAGQLGAPGSNKFLFEAAGIVEAWQLAACDIEAAAIEAGADDVEPLNSSQNDDIPEGACGARFRTPRAGTGAVAAWLKENGWTVTACELGYLPRSYPELDAEKLAEVAEFLQALEDHDDVHRVWAALR
ncbi:MAG: YebC/PmpR family DNA-binding transcriptional regulator [Terrimicrobiaceae bacterium]|nr:YebC/PmpR family DNA-binding transcriptional regulator [Terrimicrobiaceae bacterium]